MEREDGMKGHMCTDRINATVYSLHRRGRATSCELMMTDWEGGKPVKDDVYPNSEFRRHADIFGRCPLVAIDRDNGIDGIAVYQRMR